MPAVSPPALSIIITFYDETAFLKQAVQSVAAQGIRDIEIIVVNDNPDAFDPEDIHDLVAPLQVTIVSPEVNCGLSLARNLGVAQAKGELIGFLDADDYYTSTGLRRHLAYARETGADITHAQTFFSQIGTPEVEILPRDKQLFSKRRVVSGITEFQQAQFIVSSWSSLYRADFLTENSLCFDVEQRKFEDRLFVLESVTQARKIAFLGEPTRVWRRRAGSISVSPNTADIHQLQLQLLEKCLKVMRQRCSDGLLPWRMLRRETFNTVSRLIWDLDLISTISNSEGDEYVRLGKRVSALLRGTAMDDVMIDDIIVRPISRVDRKTAKGVITRSDIKTLHGMLKEGEFTKADKFITERKHSVSSVPMTADTVPGQKKVIVHLGMHKTGTTFLQHQLLLHKDALLSQGVLFPKTGLPQIGDFDVRAGALPGHQLLLSSLRGQDNETWENLKEEIRQSNAHTIILSCENFLMPGDTNRLKVIPLLAAALRDLGEVHPIALVRRPDSFFDAFYRETNFSGGRQGARSISEFMVDYKGHLTDLPALFSPLEKAFGRKVQLADFDSAREQEDLWGRFQKLCGLPGNLLEMPAPRYETPSREMTEVSRLLNTLVKDKKSRRTILRSMIEIQSVIGRKDVSQEKDYSLLSIMQKHDLISHFDLMSAKWAYERGYQVTVEAMRAAIDAEECPPFSGLSADTLEMLQNAVLQCPSQLQKPQKKGQLRTPKVDQLHKAKTEAPLNQRRKLRPRPWLRHLLARLSRVRKP